MPLGYREQQEDHRLTEMGDGSLQITNITTDDQMIYTCRAFNGIGEPATKNYRVSIRGK